METVKTLIYGQRRSLVTMLNNSRLSLTPPGCLRLCQCGLYIQVCLCLHVPMSGHAQILLVLEGELPLGCCPFKSNGDFHSPVLSLM